MLSGAQVSLYPMTDAFETVISRGLCALEPHREKVKIEIDEVSIRMLGSPQRLFSAMRDLYVAVAASRVHCVMHATLSRDHSFGDGDSAIVVSSKSGREVAETRPHGPIKTGEAAAALFTLFGSDGGRSSKASCHPLSGDAGQVFGVLSEAFRQFGLPGEPVSIDLTVSANSPILNQ